MTLYHVVAHVEYVYEIEADDPDRAADVVESGDGGHGESVNAWVERVTLPDERGELDTLADDIRKPGWCATHRCSIPPGGFCTGCLLGRPAA